jgi:hypothetical protein
MSSAPEASGCVALFPKRDAHLHFQEFLASFWELSDGLEVTMHESREESRIGAGICRLDTELRSGVLKAEWLLSAEKKDKKDLLPRFGLQLRTLWLTRVLGCLEIGLPVAYCATAKSFFSVLEKKAAATAADRRRSQQTPLLPALCYETQRWREYHDIKTHHDLLGAHLSRESFSLALADVIRKTAGVGVLLADIKPANLVVGGQDGDRVFVRLIDFDVNHVDARIVPADATPQLADHICRGAAALMMLLFLAHIECIAAAAAERNIIGEHSRSIAKLLEIHLREVCGASGWACIQTLLSHIIPETLQDVQKKCVHYFGIPKCSSSNTVFHFEHVAIPSDPERPPPDVFELKDGSGGWVRVDVSRPCASVRRFFEDDDEYRPDVVIVRHAMDIQARETFFCMNEFIRNVKRRWKENGDGHVAFSKEVAAGRRPPAAAFDGDTAATGPEIAPFLDSACDCGPLRSVSAKLADDGRVRLSALLTKDGLVTLSAPSSLDDFVVLTDDGQGGRTLLGLPSRVLRSSVVFLPDVGNERVIIRSGWAYGALSILDNPPPILWSEQLADLRYLSVFTLLAFAAARLFHTATASLYAARLGSDGRSGTCGIGPRLLERLQFALLGGAASPGEALFDAVYENAVLLWQCDASILEKAAAYYLKSVHDTLQERSKLRLKLEQAGVERRLLGDPLLDVADKERLRALILQGELGASFGLCKRRAA